MRRVVVPVLLITLAACGGDDSTAPGLDTAPLAITAQQIDSARVRASAAFDDPLLAVLVPRSPEDGNLRAARRPSTDDGASILDPSDRVVVPAALRGRRFTFAAPGGWTSTPDPSVPANGMAITIYPGAPFEVFGPAVGTLTIVDSSTATLGVAVVTARNASGTVVLRGRITEAVPNGEIITSATIGNATPPAATLADTLSIDGSRTAGRITLGAVPTSWYLSGLLETDALFRADLVLGSRVFSARTASRSVGGDSTSFTIDGRFIGALTSTRTVVGASNVNAQAVVDAAARFFGSAPQPNLFGTIVSLLLLTVRGP